MESKLLELYNEYIKMFNWDLFFETFFDANNKKNIEKKIDALQYCVENKKLFTNIDDYETLLDKYPKEDMWDL